MSLYHAEVGSRLRFNIVFQGSSALAITVFLAQKHVLDTWQVYQPGTLVHTFFKEYNIQTLLSLYILELYILIFNNKKYFNKVGTYTCGTRQSDQFYMPY